MSNVIILKSKTKAYRKMLLQIFCNFNVVAILNIFVPQQKSNFVVWWSAYKLRE